MPRVLRRYLIGNRKPVTIGDVEHADLIVIAGQNPGEARTKTNQDSLCLVVTV